MKEEINKLNFNIEEFKSNYWYSKKIEIPQFIKNIQPDITEQELFNKLLFNVFETCNLFINQKMTQFLELDITIEQITDILGKQRVKNFISSVYTEIKYRLANEKFPEFSQRDKLITSNFSLATTGREFTNFQSLLSAEAIAYLTYPSWENLKINIKDDYLNIVSVIEKLNIFDKKIEKLLNDNSEADENLKLSFSKFKSEQELKNDSISERINDLIEETKELSKNKLTTDHLTFLNQYVQNGTITGEPKNSESYLEIQLTKKGEQDAYLYASNNNETAKVEPGSIEIVEANNQEELILTTDYIKMKKRNEGEQSLTFEGIKNVNNFFSSALNVFPDQEGVYSFNNGLLYKGNNGVENETIFIGKGNDDNSDIFIGHCHISNIDQFLEDKDTIKVVSSIKSLNQEIKETKALIENNSNKDTETISRLTNLASELTTITSNNNSIKNEFNLIKGKFNEYSTDVQWVKNKLQSTQLEKRGFLQNILEKYGLEEVEFLNIENQTVAQIEEYKNNNFEQSNQALVIYKSSDEISSTTINVEWIEMGIFGYDESNGLVPMLYLEARLSQNEGGYVYNETNYFDLVDNKGSTDFVPKIKLELSDLSGSETLILDKSKLTKLKNLLG